MSALALARKGLLLAERTGLSVLTAEGLAYHMRIAAEIMHSAGGRSADGAIIHRRTHH